jgi:hypothetical protein
LWASTALKSTRDDAYVAAKSEAAGVTPKFFASKTATNLAY